MPQTGFINPYQPVPPTPLCHDEHGIVHVSAQSGSGATYVNITRPVAMPGMQVQPCDPQARAVDPPMPDMYRRLQEQMPRLELPSASAISVSGGFGGPGGQNDWEVRTQMNGRWDISRVFTHFTAQVDAQGWEEETRVVGANMAGGSWTKTVEDAEFVGALIVLMTDEDAYDLRFGLVRKGQQGIGAFGIRGVPSTVLQAPGSRIVAPATDATEAATTEPGRD